MFNADDYFWNVSYLRPGVYCDHFSHSLFVDETLFAGRVTFAVVKVYTVEALVGSGNHCLGASCIHKRVV
jgi:hypothetical protein